MKKKFQKFLVGCFNFFSKTKRIDKSENSDKCKVLKEMSYNLKYNKHGSFCHLTNIDSTEASE